LKIKALTVGPLYTNCYIISCERTGEAIIIDPGFEEHEAHTVLNEVERSGLNLVYVVNTHGHFDHIIGNRFLREEMNLPIMIHAGDAPLLTNPEMNLSLSLGLNVTSPPADILLSDGDIIRVGMETLKVIYTPGHRCGSVSMLGDGFVFTGDTLFAGSVGRTDLPGSSDTDLIRSIRDRLMSLPDDTIIYPGHGPSSTIGRERRGNPFLVDLDLI